MKRLLGLIAVLLLFSCGLWSFQPVAVPVLTALVAPIGAGLGWALGALGVGAALCGVIVVRAWAPAARPPLLYEADPPPRGVLGRYSSTQRPIDGTYEVMGEYDHK